MQHLFVNLERQMPEAEKIYYFELTTSLQEESQIEQKLLLIRKALAALKERTLKHGFPDIPSEIYFFKVVKPCFHSLLICWTSIFELDLLRPLGGRLAEVTYFSDQLKRLEAFFNYHSTFFHYYRSTYTHLDPLYYLRLENQDDHPGASFELEADVRYCSNKDRLVSKMLGYERLQKYLESLIATLEKPPKTEHTYDLGTGLRWTESKANLVELIYALQSSGVYNNGQADVKSIAAQFQKLFQVDLGNFYNVFNEIRLRKKNRTQLIDLLKEKVLKKMDDLDDR